MIVSYLLGGLGNQLFQYATARALAHKTKQYLILLPDFRNEDISRDYSLNKIGINATLCTHFKKLFLVGLSHYREKSLRFDPNVLNLKNIRLAGYWQSEKYFSDIKEILQKEFFYNVPISQQSQDIAHETTRFDSISLHIRRKDYISNASTHNFHGTCELDYYNKAVELWLTSKAPTKPHAFIFSDDPSWTQANLRLKIPTTFVTHNNQLTDHEDMWIMSRIKHHIIANSSFSWWGAWIHEKADSFNAAPKIWFKNPKAQQESLDIVPERWIRI